MTSDPLLSEMSTANLEAGLGVEGLDEFDADSYAFLPPTPIAPPPQPRPLQRSLYVRQGIPVIAPEQVPEPSMTTRCQWRLCGRPAAPALNWGDRGGSKRPHEYRSYSTYWSHPDGRYHAAQASGNDLRPLIFPSNAIKSTKYTWWNFLFLNLYEQVAPWNKLANFYFLCVAVMQAIPEISTTQGRPSILLPLFFVMAVAAVKDALEDYSKGKDDREKNRARYYVYREATDRPPPTRASGPGMRVHRPGKWQYLRSEQIRVGDIVMVPNNDRVPADMVACKAVHASSGSVDEHASDVLLPETCAQLPSSAFVFVDTKVLDGETNLKVKTVPAPFVNPETAVDLQAIKSSMHSGQVEAASFGEEKQTGPRAPSTTTSPYLQMYSSFPRQFNFDVFCDEPDGNLDEWNGELATYSNRVVGAAGARREQEDLPDNWRGKSTALNLSNLVLSGSQLRNCLCLFGVVIYTGDDTKLRQNMKAQLSQFRTKSTHLLRMVRRCFIFLASFQVLMCLVMCAGNGYFLDQFSYQYTSPGYALDQTVAVPPSRIHNGTVSFAAGQWYMMWGGEGPVAQQNGVSVDTAYSADTPFTTRKMVANFFTWFIIFKDFLPISLYVTLEMVQFIQGVYIGWDAKMRVHQSYFSDGDEGEQSDESDENDAETDFDGDAKLEGIELQPREPPDPHPNQRDTPEFIYSGAHTPALNESLSQVTHIFTDKTGTLTRNRMSFKKCHVRGAGQYGLGTTEAGVVQVLRAPGGDGGGVGAVMGRLKALERAFLSRSQWELGADEQVSVEQALEFTNDVDEGDDPSTQVAVAEAMAFGLELFNKQRKKVAHLRKLAAGRHARYFDVFAERMCDVPAKRVPNVEFNDFSRFIADLRGDSSTDDSVPLSAPQDSSESKNDVDRKRMLRHFCVCLAINNSIYPSVDAKRPGTVKYESSSPDESALCQFSRSLGFELFQRSANAVKVRVTAGSSADGREEVLSFQNVTTFDFNSKRKRMTVIVRAPGHSDRLLVYTKGADSTVVPLLRHDADLARERDRSLLRFSSECLRCLVLGVAEVPASWWFGDRDGGHADTTDNDKIPTDRRPAQGWKAALDAVVFHQGDAERGHATGSCDKACRICALQQRIEQDVGLEYVGVTGIEDELQPHVARTLLTLKHAGISIWMLTGDNIDTAINIGMACNLIDPSFLGGGKSDGMLFEVSKRQFLEGPDPEIPLHYRNTGLTDAVAMDTVRLADVHKYLQQCCRMLIGHTAEDDLEAEIAGVTSSSDEKQADTEGHIADADSRLSLGVPDYAVVFDGSMLRFLLRGARGDGIVPNAEPLRLFLTLCKHGSSVVASRLEPVQKAQIVSLIQGPQPGASKAAGSDDDIMAALFDEEGVQDPETVPVCLAIGDGNNDIPMLKTAHIGVAIHGVEGGSAIAVSDYSLGLFCFLSRLLLVHGRLNDKRLSILIPYMFYKSHVLVWCLFLFGWYSGFSGQLIYLDWVGQFHNIAYTALPIVIIAIFHTDLPETVLEQCPFLYVASRWPDGNRFLTPPVVARWMVTAFVHGAICFYCGVLAHGDGAIDSTGQTYGLWAMGLTIYTAVVWVSNCHLLLKIQLWTWLHVLSIVGSLISFYVIVAIFASSPAFAIGGADYTGVYARLLETPVYHLVALLAIGATLSLDLLLEGGGVAFWGGGDTVRQCVEAVRLGHSDRVIRFQRMLQRQKVQFSRPQNIAQKLNQARRGQPMQRAGYLALHSQTPSLEPESGGGGGWVGVPNLDHSQYTGGVYTATAGASDIMQYFVRRDRNPGDMGFSDGLLRYYYPDEFHTQQSGKNSQNEAQDVPRRTRSARRESEDEEKVLNIGNILVMNSTADRPGYGI